MRKLNVCLCLFLALTLFFACAHTRETAVDRPAAPGLDRIVRNGELVVGTAGTMPPLNMTTKKGDIIGIEPDIARGLAEAIGVRLRIEPMPFSELLSSLEAGKVDMVMSGMTMTPQRNMKVAFVGPYFVTGKAFLTKIETIASAGDAAKVDSPERTLVALKGSTSQGFAEALLPRATLLAAGNYDEAIEMVIKGKADAMVADYPICLVALLRYPDAGFLSVLTTLSYEPIGVAIPAHDTHLANLVGNYLKSLRGAGLLESMKKRWTEDASWLLLLP